MQTIKTSVVVVLLLVVLYGAYDILTRPDQVPPPEVTAALNDTESLAPPDISFDPPVVASPDQTQTQISPANNFSQDNTIDTINNGYSFSDPDSIGEAPAIPITPEPPISRSVASDSTQEQGSVDTEYYDEPVLENPPRVASSYDHQSTDSSPGSVAELVTTAPTPRAGERAYLRVRAAAEKDLSDGHYREALAKLSIFYHSPDLSNEEHQELLNWLDPLAARVVYSRESLLAQPYIVNRSDTLMQIAAAYQVPWQLIQRINGVKNPEVLIAGTQIKIVPGPFRGEVRLQDSELTVFLGELYAGRFPVTFGQDPTPRAGDYLVRDKQTARDFFAVDGRTIPAGSPLNPYGHVWLDLGSDFCIHGSPDQPNTVPQGCIGLSPRDAQDIFSILSVGSEIKIRP